MDCLIFLHSKYKFVINEDWNYEMIIEIWSERNMSQF